MMSLVLTLSEHGAERHAAAALEVLPALRAALSGLPEHRAGTRIQGIDALAAMLSSTGSIGLVASRLLGSHCFPVRAILFDKTAKTNWSLGWHQDRTICVEQRVDVEGYSNWTIKRGMQHVAPPFDLLSKMITLRVHLDDVAADNAPLLIAPGSHAVGLVPTCGYAEVVEHFGIRACLARAGDVWAYATPILHASEVTKVAVRRRVLQVDYSADQLPGGLDWLGI